MCIDDNILSVINLKKLQNIYSQKINKFPLEYPASEN